MKANEIPNETLIKRDVVILLNENQKYRRHLESIGEGVDNIIRSLQNNREYHNSCVIELAEHPDKEKDQYKHQGRVNGVQMSLNKLDKLKALLRLYGV